MDRLELLTFICEKFNDQELRDLCFALTIDYESLPGEGKAAKARELVAYCERRDRLLDLEQTAQRMSTTGSPPAPSARSGVNVAGNYTDQSTYGDTYHVQIDHAENLAIGSGARVNVNQRPPASTPQADRASLQRQLDEARANLKLIQERKAEYVLAVDVPLQLVKEERRLRIASQN